MSLQDFRQLHKQRGWRDVGYHYIVFPDGRVERGRPISQPGAHCHGHNAHSIGVAYVGGLGRDGSHQDTRTPEQKQALLKLVYQLIQMYRCDVYGHRDMSPDANGNGVVEPGEWIKDCPCFDAHAEYHHLWQQVCSIPKIIQK